MTTDTNAPAQPPITVVDSIMGSGKTTYAIGYMNACHEKNLQDAFSGLPGDRRFLYVTPLLSEVERVQKACGGLRFRDPMPIHGRKFYHLEQLIDAGENVATTHTLFSLLSPAIYKRLKEQNYTLVIDEVLSCCDHFTGLSKDDRTMLFEGGHVFVDAGTSRLRWNHAKWPSYRGEFERVMNLCDNGNLVAYVPKGAPNKDAMVILWQFPSEFLQCFSRVMVLTYLFHGSPMRSYLEAEGLTFDMRSVGKSGLLVPWEENVERETKAKLRQLVTIYEGKLNAIGTPKNRENPLSSSWFKRAPATAYNQLRQATMSFFKLHAKTAPALNAWTTFKERRADLRGVRYGKEEHWIPLNAKATNEYKEKRSLAYLANRFSLPVIKSYFAERGVLVNDDLYALSEMAQWIWRSAIREGQPIKVYVPSDRMRGLLRRWLACDDTLTFVNATSAT